MGTMVGRAMERRLNMETDGEGLDTGEEQLQGQDEI